MNDGFRVKQISTTIGTGELTLITVPGFVDFSTLGGIDSTFFYSIQDGDGFKWEYGIGSMIGGKLQRTTVLGSSNNNALINLSSGSHVVANTPIPGYATGRVDFQGQILQRPLLMNYSEVISTPVISSGILTLDLNVANVFKVSHNANITSLIIANPPVSSVSKSITLYLVQDSVGGRSITLPSNFKWSGRTPGSLTSSIDELNKLVIDTIDGGVTYHVALAGKDYA